MGRDESTTRLTLDTRYFEESDASSLRLADAYKIGSNIEELQSKLSSGVESHGARKEDLLVPLEDIESTLRGRDFDSSITAQVTTARDRIREQEDTVEPDLCDRINQQANIWERVVLEELKREKVVPVDDSGIFDVNSLVNDPSSLFDEPIWDKLDEMPKGDLVESSRDLAIGSSTSSVIMSLRAVEYCLREWYMKEKGEELNIAWGAVLDQLMDEYTDESKKNSSLLHQMSDLPPVLSNLYYLKEKRNEVNHPDESPDIHEAQRTLMIVVSTISEIYEEIEPSIAYSEVDIELSDDYEDKEDLIYNIIKAVEGKDPDGSAQKDAVYQVGKKLDLTREQIGSAILNNLFAGQIYEPTDDRLKAI